MEILLEKFYQLKNTFTQNPPQKTLLVVHPSPDADALGALLALDDFLKKNFASQNYLFSPDPPPQNLNQLFPYSQITQTLPDNFSVFDTLFFLDRGDVFYKLNLDKKVSATNFQGKIVNIDHHPHTFIPEAINILDIQAAATCEIIFRLFEFFQFPINPTVAQYLLNGLYADTGGFRHNNTSPACLEISATLLKKGASIVKANREIFAQKSLGTLKLWAIALERARINPKTGMVVSFITKEDLKNCQVQESQISSISEILNTISESRFSLVLSEKESGKIKASLRSEEYKGVDVSAIARKFKGGGHKLASGFEIKGKLTQVGDSWIIE